MTVIYRADDGTEFSNAKECLEYERNQSGGGFWLFILAAAVIAYFLI